MFTNNPAEIMRSSWDDRLVDVTDVFETPEELTQTALLNINCYNNVTQRRSYCRCPIRQPRCPTMSGGR